MWAGYLRAYKPSVSESVPILAGTHCTYCCTGLAQSALPHSCEFTTVQHRNAETGLMSRTDRAG